MAIETTPLGYQLPDGDEPLRNGDDVISHNGRLSQELLAELRSRTANLEGAAGFSGDPLDLNDSAVAQALSGGTETPAALTQALTSYQTKADAAAEHQALQNAIDAKETAISTFADLQTAVAAGGLVEVSSTPITITATLQVPAGTLIRGGNFTLPANAGYPAFQINASNVSIESARFTGAGTGAAYDINSRFIYAYGSLTTYLKNVNVRNCQMDGSQTENIRFVCVRNFKITGNSMDDFLYAGFLGLSVENGDVSGNIVTNAVMKSPVVNVYGIAISDSVNTVAARSRHVRIIGNHVENIPWEGIDTHGGEDLIIVGNVVLSCVRGIALVVGNADRLTVPVRCIVANNFVDIGTATDTTREGISLFGLAGNLATATITGNRVRGYSAANSIYLSQYVDHTKTLIEGNSHPHIPWTDITLDNAASWTPDATYKPQYMVEGRQVYLRGFALSKSSSTANSKIGTLPPVASTDRLTFAGASHGSNSAAGTGTLGVYPNGDLYMLYRTGADLYSYPLECSYQRNYVPS